MCIQFLKQHTRAGEHRPRRAGELADLPDDEATILITEGIAKLHEFRPTETKTRSYDPAEYEDPDDDGGYAPV